MDCHKIKQLLDELAHGELSPAQREIVEEHLKACPLCQKELSAIRHTTSVLKGFREVDEPPDFLQRVRQRIESRQPRPILRRLFPRAALARVAVSVCCLALVASGFWFLYRQLSPKQPPTLIAKYPRGGDAKPVELARRYLRSEEILSEEARKPASGVAGGRARFDAMEEPEKEEEHLGDRASGRLRHKKGVDAIGKGEDAAVPDTIVASNALRRAQEKLAEEGSSAADLGIEERMAGTDAKDTRLDASFRGKEAVELKTLEKGHGGLPPPAKARPEDSGDFAGVAVPKRGTEAAIQPRLPAGSISAAIPAEPEEVAPAITDESRSRVAGFAEMGAKAEPEAPSVSAARGVLGKAPARPATQSIDRPHDKDADTSENLQSQQALEGVPLLPGAEFKAGQTPDDKKGKAGYFYDRADGDAVSKGDFAAKLGEALMTQLHGTELLRYQDFLLHSVTDAERYYVIEGVVPELVFVVRDRAKAAAAIKKMIADLGGTVSLVAEKTQQPEEEISPAEAEVFAVKLKAEAYGSLWEKLAPRKPAGELSSGLVLEGQLHPQVAREKTRGEETVTFRIRLLEVSTQEQPQQRRDN